jgi:hypothetical protein
MSAMMNGRGMDWSPSISKLSGKTENWRQAEEDYSMETLRTDGLGLGDDIEPTLRWLLMVGMTEEVRAEKGKKMKFSVSPDFSNLKRIDHDYLIVEHGLRKHKAPKRDQLAVWAAPVELHFEYTFTGLEMENLTGLDHKVTDYRFYRDRFAWCLADVKATT